MPKKPKPFNNPFADAAKQLKKQIKNAEAPPPPPPPKAPKPQPEEEDESATFARWMQGAKPIGADDRGRIPPEVPPGDARAARIHDEEGETLAELASLIDGTGAFDIADSDEFVEGSIEGLDRRILRRLRAGDYSVRAHIDLHGMTRDPARAAVERFIAEARRDRHRCVLIVHGRGLNSKDHTPVLKPLLVSWLSRGRISRSILAFATARPHDGGAGAVYVLLRK